VLLEKVRGARREASPHFFFVVIVFYDVSSRFESRVTRRVDEY
jgi:hypothetical protein